MMDAKGKTDLESVSLVSETLEDRGSDIQVFVQPI